MEPQSRAQELVRENRHDEGRVEDNRAGATSGKNMAQVLSSVYTYKVIGCAIRA